MYKAIKQCLRSRGINRCFWQRRYITLLELLIAISIMAIVTGLIGIQIYSAVQEQRWKADTSAVRDLLRLAQQLMLILDQDVNVILSPAQEGGIEGHLTFQCPLSPGWQRELSQRQRYYRTIENISFSNKDQSTQQKEVTLNFLSGGVIMSRGLLHLQGRSALGAIIEKNIFLKGSPAPINFSSAPEEDFRVENEARAIEIQLTQSVVQEVTPIKERQSKQTNGESSQNGNKQTPTQPPGATTQPPTGQPPATGRPF